jgi:hypothetical protein
MNNATYDRKFVAMMRKLRKVQGSLNALQGDLFGAAGSGSTPQALFEDRLLGRLGLVRGQCYPEEEITRRLKRAGVTDATERLAAKIELEQMGIGVSADRLYGFGHVMALGRFW